MNSKFMKKDVIIALICGFIIGSILAVTTISFPKIINFFQNPTKDTKPPEIQATPTPVIKEIPFEIYNPKNNEILGEKNINIDGKTDPDSLVIAELPSDTQTTISGIDGKFSIKIPAEEGVNRIIITVINKEGDEKSSELTTFFTTEKI